MKPFDGAVPRGAHVDLLVNDALGNACVASTVVGLVRRSAPDATVTLWSGGRVEGLVDGIDAFVPVARTGDLARRMAVAARQERGPLDVVFNLESDASFRALAAELARQATMAAGPVGDGVVASTDLRDLWARDWKGPLTSKGLRGSFIGEVFRVGLGLPPDPDGPWFGTLPRYALRRTAAMDAADGLVVVAPGASTPDKLWSAAKWCALLPGLQQLGPVVVVGAPPAYAQLYATSDGADSLVASGAMDARGKWTLPELVDVVARARVVVGIDNGIMHLAAGCSTPVVALFRQGFAKLWAPPDPLVYPVEAGELGVAAIEVHEVWEATQTLVRWTPPRP